MDERQTIQTVRFGAASTQANKKNCSQWLPTILFRYFIHRLSVMECTWLIYVNVIDCAEVMINCFCSPVICLSFFPLSFYRALSICLSASFNVKRDFIAYAGTDFKWFRIGISVASACEKWAYLQFWIVSTYCILQLNVKYRQNGFQMINVTNWHNGKLTDALNRSLD